MEDKINRCENLVFDGTVKPGKLEEKIMEKQDQYLEMLMEDDLERNCKSLEKLAILLKKNKLCLYHIHVEKILRLYKINSNDELSESVRGLASFFLAYIPRYEDFDTCLVNSGYISECINNINRKESAFSLYYFMQRTDNFNFLFTKTDLCNRLVQTITNINTVEDIAFIIELLRKIYEIVRKRHDFLNLLDFFMECVNGVSKYFCKFNIDDMHAFLKLFNLLCESCDIFLNNIISEEILRYVLTECEFYQSNPIYKNNLLVSEIFMKIVSYLPQLNFSLYDDISSFVRNVINEYKQGSESNILLNVAIISIELCFLNLDTFLDNKLNELFNLHFLESYSSKHKELIFRKFIELSHSCSEKLPLVLQNTCFFTFSISFCSLLDSDERVILLNFAREVVKLDEICIKKGIDVFKKLKATDDFASFIDVLKRVITETDLPEQNLSNYCDVFNYVNSFT